MAAAQFRSISLQSAGGSAEAALNASARQQPRAYNGIWSQAQEFRPVMQSHQQGFGADGGGAAGLYGAPGAPYAGPGSGRAEQGAASAFVRLPSASEILTPRSNLLANIWGDAPDSSGGGAPLSAGSTGGGHPGAVRRVQSTHVPGSPGAVHYAMPAREFYPTQGSGDGSGDGSWAEKMESLLKNLDK